MDPGSKDAIHPETKETREATVLGDNASSGSSHGDVEAGEVYVIDHKAERALCRKFDFRLLPKTDGLEKDLNFRPHDYNLILSIFYVPYVLFAPPIGMLGKKFGPSRVLPIMMFCFGFLTLMGIAVKNFGGMMALRWFLGMSESAFFPLVIYYQTTFYRRGELARRLAIFYAAQSIANAFSGLLAFGVFHIDSHIPSWRFLFVIEGSCTVLFSFFAYWYLPHSAPQAWFLNEEEKKLAYHRMQVDSSSIVNEEFNLKDSLKIFRLPVAYCWLAIEICLGVPLQSVSLFLPQIVSRLKYSVVKTNLYTVAPNITGAIMLLILAFASDYTRLRFPFIAAGFAFTFIGFIIFVSTDENHTSVLLLSTYLMTWGTSAPSVLLSTWYNNNVAHEGRRVVLTSCGVPLANLMGVVSSNIFQNKDAPKYTSAVATTAAFGATGCCLAAALGLWMMLDNKRRNMKQGVNLTARDVSTAKLRDGPKSPDFRWFL